MITVIMPAYNASKYISEAIESILNQTYPNFELIVINDGSTDNTLEIVNRYAAKDSRVVVIEGEHKGANYARNLGMKRAKYPWVAMMDADDISVPERLEKQLKAAEANPDVVLWGCYMNQINEHGKILGMVRTGPPSKEAFYALDLTQSNIDISTPTAMFKRDVALQVGGFDVRLVAAQESELWDRLADHGPAVVVPEPLLLYRLHGDSVSVKRFYQQRMLIHFPKERRKARAQGKDLTLDEYIQNYQNQPPLKRLSRRIGHIGHYYYRHTGKLVAEGRYLAAVGSFILGFLMAPRLTISRLTNRFFPKQSKSTHE